MATNKNKGPLFGSRVSVTLPFGPARDKRKPVYMKRPVADYFDLTVDNIKTYSTQNKNAKDGRKTTNRVKRGTYRYKSIKVVFTNPQTLKDPKSGRSRTVNTVSFPLPAGTHVADAYEWLSGKAKTKKLDKMITPDGSTLPFQY